MEIITIIYNIYKKDENTDKSKIKLRMYRTDLRTSSFSVTRLGSLCTVVSRTSLRLSYEFITSTHNWTTTNKLKDRLRR